MANRICLKKWVFNIIFVVGWFACASVLSAEEKGTSKVPKGMVFISAGQLTMGAEPNRAIKVCLKNNRPCKLSWFEDEEPVHSVRLKGFFIDSYEVTQKNFLQVMGENPSDFKGPDLPVEQVTWYEAVEYCKKLGKRLPTEAEWEWAARGGVDSTFSWGENAESEKANFCDRRCDKRWKESQFDDGYRHTAPVGSFPANGYGVFDMAGNVYEWVADWYDEDYYKISPRDNPKGPPKGKRKVIRGGSWINYSAGVRPSDRTEAKPKGRSNFVGFRCAL